MAAVDRMSNSWSAEAGQGAFVLTPMLRRHLRPLGRTDRQQALPPGSFTGSNGEPATGTGNALLPAILKPRLSSTTRMSQVSIGSRPLPGENLRDRRSVTLQPRRRQPSVPRMIPLVRVADNGFFGPLIAKSSAVRCMSAFDILSVPSFDISSAPLIPLGVRHEV